MHLLRPLALRIRISESKFRNPKAPWAQSSFSISAWSFIVWSSYDRACDDQLWWMKWIKSFVWILFILEIAFHMHANSRWFSTKSRISNFFNEMPSEWESRSFQTRSFYTKSFKTKEDQMRRVQMKSHRMRTCQNENLPNEKLLNTKLQRRTSFQTLKSKASEIAKAASSKGYLFRCSSIRPANNVLAWHRRDNRPHVL